MLCWTKRPTDSLIPSLIRHAVESERQFGRRMDFRRLHRQTTGEGKRNVIYQIRFAETTHLVKIIDKITSLLKVRVFPKYKTMFRII